MDTDSYESSLSDPESDYMPAAKTKAAAAKKKKAADSNGYRIEHILKPPRATTYTAQSLVGAPPSCFQTVPLSETPLHRANAPGRDRRGPRVSAW